MKIIIPLIIGLIFVSISPAFALEQNGVIEMPFTENPPSIDGGWTTADEWKDASETLVTREGQQMFILTKHDRDYLYVMVDVVSQQSNVYPSYGVSLMFDTNGNGGSVMGVDDFDFYTVTGGGQPILQQGNGNGQRGVVSNPAGYNAAVSWSSTNDPYEGGRSHPVFEFQIPLNFLHKFDRYGFGVMYYAYDPLAHLNWWPSSLSIFTPSSWGGIVAPKNTVTAPPVPFIVLSTKSIAFENVAVSDKSTATITITNTGTGALRITNIRGSNEFSVQGILFPVSIEPNKSLDFSILFAPLSLGEKSGTIFISSNDLSYPTLAIEVSGKGVEKGKPLGGGCLIATAAFGTELAPQVQLLRELRDDAVLRTSSGTTLMSAFNDIYYSFSPTVADWERQNPVFKEAVRITLTPMLSTLSILNYVNIDSEEKMLGYGVGVILLNVGMYFAIPAFAVMRLKRISHRLKS